MIVTLLLSDTDLHLVVACLTCGTKKSFRKKLASLVEFIIGPLRLALVGHTRQGECNEHSQLEYERDQCAW